MSPNTGQVIRISKKIKMLMKRETANETSQKNEINKIFSARLYLILLKNSEVRNIARAMMQVIMTGVKSAGDSKVPKIK